jgi:putative PIN family toxin of toxin-antitoxin system
MSNIVLDTNVIVSAILSPNGICSKIMNIFLNGGMQVYYNAGILSEYKDVLFRASLDLNIEKRKEFFEIIREAGILIEPTVSNILLPDESDRIFYDTAVESGAILITFNIKHYPIEPFIMTPVEFIRKLSEG